MSLAYGIVLILMFFTGALPLSIFSVIWNAVSVNMTVGVLYVGILRTLIVLGAVLASVLSDRMRRSFSGRELIIAGLCLEGVSLIGFSLSRVFWHLCIWTVVLGFGIGMSLTLLCFLAAFFSGRVACLLFAGSSCGIAAGALLLDTMLGQEGSWRGACQTLGFCMVVLTMAIFLVRRSICHKTGTEEYLHERKLELERRRDRQSIISRRTEPDSSAIEKSVAGRFAAVYVAAGMSSFFGMSACLWPESYRALSGIEGRGIVGGIAAVSLAITAGRALSAVFALRRKVTVFLSTALLTAAAAAECILMCTGTLSDGWLLFFQIMEGAGIGPLLPSFVLMDYSGFDHESFVKLRNLIPSFYLAGWILITPVTQAMVKSGQTDHFAVWSLTAALVLGAAVLLLFCGKTGAADDETWREM